jgi:hypothetical protein
MRHPSIFMTLIALLLSPLSHPTYALDNKEMDTLLYAIRIVESHNDANALGDRGKAIGTYQIHRSFWIDGTAILSVDWQYSDAKDARKAEQVVRAYLQRYGKGKSLLDVARIYNGGPQGDRKHATLEYARKISRIIRADPPKS